MLKLLIQCHLSEKQLIYIQKTIIDNISSIIKDTTIVKTLLIDTNAVVKPDTDKYASVNYFLNTIDTMQIKMWCAYIDICVDLRDEDILADGCIFADGDQEEVI